MVHPRDEFRTMGGVCNRLKKYLTPPLEYGRFWRSLDTPPRGSMDIEKRRAGRLRFARLLLLGFILVHRDLEKTFYATNILEATLRIYRVPGKMWKISPDSHRP
ncbi:hypothetical protein NQ317_012699 [Molorchus minor]|uniref:Uncharacterized protein n=1 Tax=Molorchus minor TaxID=1323400 RepID=A0ABQ9IY29_9CUCU|nr:hypothetical protein NQ317_012699 [Molorchus minor]